jgi:long-chain fatty acid transport protein
VALILFLGTRAKAGNGALPIANSPEAAGRGGAQIAVPDEASSVAVNPAGLALLDRGRIDLGLGFYLTRSSFLNSRNNDRSEDLVPTPAPLLAFAMPFELGEEESLGFGVALTPIGGGNSIANFRTAAYPEGERERSDLALLGLTAGVSVKMLPRISLGMGLTAIYASLAESGITGGGNTSNGTVRNFSNGQLAPGNFLVNGQSITWGQLLDSVRAPDTFATSRISIAGAKGFGASGVLGAVIDVVDGLSIGLTYRTPGWLTHLDGKAYLDASQSAAAGSAALNQIQSSFLANHLPDGGRGLASRYDISLGGLRVPQAAGIGIAGWPTEQLLLAFDVQWIGWSTAFDEVSIDLKHGRSRDILEITSNQMSSTIHSKVLYHWRDQVVVAAGAAFSPFDWLVLRAGYNWGSNPVPSKTENPFVSATVEHHLTFGLGFRFDDFSIDLAYVHAFVKATTIQDSVSNPEWSGMRHKADQDAILIGGSYRF